MKQRQENIRRWVANPKVMFLQIVTLLEFKAAATLEKPIFFFL